MENDFQSSSNRPGNYRNKISRIVAVNSEADIYYQKVSFNLFSYLPTSQCSRTKLNKLITWKVLLKL